MTSKVAISMPASVLADIERSRKSTGETRSAFFRRAAEIEIARERERQQVKRYVEGYRRFPETDEDLEIADAGLAAVFAENPWEPEAKNAKG